MYVSFINDRKSLGYTCLKDTRTGNLLVFVIDSKFLFVKDAGCRLSSSVKNKTGVIVVEVAVVVSILFSLLETKPVNAIGLSPPPTQQQLVRSLTKEKQLGKKIFFIPSSSSLNLDSQPIILMPSFKLVKNKSQLKNPYWVKKFICSIRGGDDQKLVRSILAKLSDSDLDLTSINKILKRIAKVSFEIGKSEKLWRILSEFEKPIPQSHIFADGFVYPLPRHRSDSTIKKNKYFNPSNEFSLDSSKCYGKREEYYENTPRLVSENFKTKSVKKLCKMSLRNSRMKKEYLSIKQSMKQGTHPVKISKRSTYVSSTKILIKKPEGRYLVEVSNAEAKILDFSSRKSDQSMSKFERLMNELYGLNLKGY